MYSKQASVVRDQTDLNVFRFTFSISPTGHSMLNKPWRSLLTVIPDQMRLKRKTLWFDEENNIDLTNIGMQ